MVLPVVVVTVIAMVIDSKIVVVAMVVLVKSTIVVAQDTIPMIVAIGVIETTMVVGALTDMQVLVKTDQTDQTDMLGVKNDVAAIMDVMRNVVLAFPGKIATMVEVEVVTIAKNAMRRGKIY